MPEDSVSRDIIDIQRKYQADLKEGLGMVSSDTTRRVLIMPSTQRIAFEALLGAYISDEKNLGVQNKQGQSAETDVLENVLGAIRASKGIGEKNPTSGHYPNETMILDGPLVIAAYDFISEKFKDIGSQDEVTRKAFPSARDFVDRLVVKFPDAPPAPTPKDKAANFLKRFRPGRNNQ